MGKTPETAPALLTFLTLLAEEAAENGKIDPTVGFHGVIGLDEADCRQNNDVLTEANAAQVLNLLSVYIQATGQS